jgi:hypothetical protein
MTDLRISYNELETAHNAMSGLLSDFDQNADIASEYDTALGSVSVSGAMAAFSGNWSLHRQKLEHQMRTLQTMLGSALQKFPDTDRGLASDLTKKR